MQLKETAVFAWNAKINVSLKLFRMEGLRMGLRSEEFFFFKNHWLKTLKFDSGRLNQTENTEISVIWFRKTIPKFRYILVISALTVSVDHWPLRLLLVDTLFIALFTHFCLLLCAILENISLVLQYSLQEINLAIKCLLSSWRLCLFNFSNWF